MDTEEAVEGGKRYRPEGDDDDIIMPLLEPLLGLNEGEEEGCCGTTRRVEAV
jgi:hypothetical protein